MLLTSQTKKDVNGELFSVYYDFCAGLACEGQTVIKLTKIEAERLNHGCVIVRFDQHQDLKIVGMRSFDPTCTDQEIAEFLLGTLTDEQLIVEKENMIRMARATVSADDAQHYLFKWWLIDYIQVQRASQKRL